MKSIHRSMACVAAAAVVCSVLLAAPGRAQQDAAKAELRYQALNVFQRHCLKCHGDAAKGGVRIVDHTLLVKERQVIHPGSPETSELFDLVQGGSMPPGTCPKVPEKELAFLKEWIRAGAESLPNTHDESYVLWSIVCDLRTMTDEQKRSIRYLSLNHLLAQDSTIRNLAEQRENLQRVLGKFVPEGKQPPKLSVIEPTSTVFRIDLQDLGWWDRPPYPEAEQRWRSLSLFDLILLEYQGRLPTSSPFYPELLKFLLVLQEAGQVRPIPYVRADWLVEVIGQPQSPLHSDFLKVLGKSPQSKPARGGQPRPDPLDALASAAKYQARGGSVEKPKRREAPILALPPLSLRGGDEKERESFRARLAGLLDGDTKSGLPIKPLDGLTYRPKPSSDVQFRAIDFQDRALKNPPVKDPFAPEDRMALWIKSKRSVVAEVIHTDLNSGSKFKLKFDDQRESFECKGDIAKVWSGEKGIRMQLSPKEEQDSEEFTIYAYPGDDQKATSSDFPKGILLRAEGIHDRVVHPLYKLRADGHGFEPPDAGKMVEVTITITTKRKKD